jgi:hypothetical protein
MTDHLAQLDGNAAAGLLAQIFAVDVTTATITCASCQSSGEIGALEGYCLEMGAILRCPGCQAAVVRIGRNPGGYVLDMHGAGPIRIDTSA